MRISEAADATGLPATTLRYWEQIGLIRSARTGSGYRVFDGQALERLRFIGAAKRLDLSLDTIRELLRTWDDDTCASVKRRLQPMVADRLAQAEQGITELAELADVLRAGLARLNQLPDRDTACDPGCSFLDAAPVVPVSEPVIACSLTGGDHADRLDRWHTLLDIGVVTRGGLAARVTLPAEHAATTAELVRTEQDCCPFLAFRVDFHGPTVTLTITVPNDTAAPFLDALLPTGATA